MSNYSEEQLNRIWAKGRTVFGLNADVYRLDVVGAMMKRSCYGKEESLGWEVDHIFPKKMLEECKIPEELHDNILNLHPMNSKNNVKKGNDYPGYKSALEYDANLRMNVENEFPCTVDTKLQAALADLFGLNEEL